MTPEQREQQAREIVDKILFEPVSRKKQDYVNMLLDFSTHIEQPPPTISDSEIEEIAKSKFQQWHGKTANVMYQEQVKCFIEGAKSMRSLLQGNGEEKE